jgi:phosphoribosyl-ATP pyrophosphohydrolase
VSQQICTYDKNQIMLAVTEETGELATEVAISIGYKKREPSPDGVIGEAVDLIITAIDMMNAHQPGITVEEIFEIVENKCNKWASKTFVRYPGCCCPPPGYSGLWAAAMCPIHFGLRRPK